MNLLGRVYATGSIAIPQPTGMEVDDLGQLISASVGVLLIVAAILAFLYLVLGGIQWITSGGDKAGMEAARNKITHAIVGLVIVAAAFAIILLAQQFLGITLFDEGTTIPSAVGG